MPVKVSVVVPVYNPGPHLEPLLTSLARQSLPQDEFEAIFVDDGSTDDTPARLARLAAETPNVTVIRQENSGWPGKPRNVGVDAARGEYVFFCDNDDWLGDEALARLYATARRNDADIVIGKMVGHNRGVPVELFRRNVDRATLADTPLIDSLTPHKLFRTAFLRESGLRFPEGRRRLEDHVFVVRAYFLARTISVLADYPVYHHIRRDDASNAAFLGLDPPSYYGYVRETLDIVEEHTEPGPLRDRLLRRFLRQELLQRLDGRRLPKLDRAYRESLFAEIVRLTEERFPTSVEAGLPGRQRVLAGLVRRGELPPVLALAEWSAGVRLTPVLDDLQWEAGVLRVTWHGRLAAADGPLLRRDGDRLLLQPPDAASLPAEILDVTRDERGVRAAVVARLRDGAHDVLLPTTQVLAVDAEGALVVSGTADLDPERAVAGAPLERGVWDISLRLRAFGWSSDVRLGKARAPSVEGSRVPRLVGNPVRLALPYWTVPHGNLSLDIDGSAKPLGGLLRMAPEEAAVAPTGPDTWTVAVPLGVDAAAAGAATVRLTARADGREYDVPARIEPAAAGATLIVTLPASVELAGRTWELALRLLRGGVAVPTGVEAAALAGEPPVLRRAGAAAAAEPVSSDTAAATARPSRWERLPGRARAAQVGRRTTRSVRRRVRRLTRRWVRRLNRAGRKVSGSGGAGRHEG